MMHISNLEVTPMSFPTFTRYQIFVSRGVKPSSRFSRKVLSSEIGRGSLYRHDACSVLLHSIVDSTEDDHSKGCSARVWISCSDSSAV